MKTLKKWIAFMLAAGLIVTAVKVTAVTVLADSGSAITYPSGEMKWNDKGGIDFIGPDMPTWGKNNRWYNTKRKIWLIAVKPADGVYVWQAVLDDSESNHTTENHLSEEDIAAIEARAEAEAVQQGASDEGFSDVGDMYRAAEKNMSAGEFYNNVVTSTPGIENAVTVGQGGNLVVNGEVTNMTATITKVTNRAYVDSVRISQPEGVLLNVVDVQYPAVEATINFYMPSVTAETDIVAMQYNAGTWVNVDVAEVREDHVVLDMKGNGVIAFIAK